MFPPRLHAGLVLGLLLWAGLATGLKAQADPQAIELFRRGELILLEGDAESAIRSFRQALRISPGFSAARRSLGISLMLNEQFSAAAREFDQVLASDSLYARTLYFQSGLAHYQAGEFELALDRFNRYDSLLQQPDYIFGLHGEREAQMDSTFRAELPLRIRACRFSMEASFLAEKGHFTHLGKPINTAADEYFPFLSNNQRWMYFTRRKSPVLDEDLMVAEKRGKNWSGGRLVSGGINTTNNEGMSTFVRNGRHMYFTACGRSDVLGTCDLWRADLFEGAIIDFGSLGPVLNSESWDSQAAVSCDGTVLYFSSYREGGYGGADLWMSDLQEDGSWSPPVNLGPTVNTKGDEEAPFITNDGESLFFSSTGLPGQGESDIFVSWRTPEGNWSLPINLGPPVNSPHHELGFFLSADNKTAFISSDRPGGEGGMDLYRFDLPPILQSQAITFVQGKVYDAVSLQPIVTQVQIGEDRAINTEQDGRFFLCVPADATLDLRVYVRGYSLFQDFFRVPEHHNRSAFAIPIGLQPLGRGQTSTADSISTEELVEEIEEAFAPTRGKEYQHNVYFDFNSSQLLPEQKDELLRFIEGLPPGIIARIDISGYTDGQGSVTYNLRLSEERAKQVGQFLQANNLQVSNIFMKGAGEFLRETSENQKRRVEIRIWIEE